MSRCSIKKRRLRIHFIISLKTRLPEHPQEANQLLQGSGIQDPVQLDVETRHTLGSFAVGSRSANGVCLVNLASANMLMASAPHLHDGSPTTVHQLTGQPHLILISLVPLLDRLLGL